MNKERSVGRQERRTGGPAYPEPPARTNKIQRFFLTTERIVIILGLIAVIVIYLLSGRG